MGKIDGHVEAVRRLAPLQETPKQIIESYKTAKQLARPWTTGMISANQPGTADSMFRQELARMLVLLGVNFFHLGISGTMFDCQPVLCNRE